MQRGARLFIMTTYLLKDIATQFNLAVHGDPSCEVSAIGAIESAQAGEISFFRDRAKTVLLQQTKASVVVMSAKHLEFCPQNALICDNPDVAFAKIARFLNPVAPLCHGIHTSAVIAEDAILAEGVAMGPHCHISPGVKIGINTQIAANVVIGPNVSIGDDCRIYPNVTVYAGVQIADRVEIHSGAVIAADGFGLANDDGHWVPVPQLGSVVIHSDVSIGANTTIDRGSVGDTVIEEGVKLDNHIQIAHNVRIGAHTAIAACTGIAGSTTIGSHCMIAGHVGIADHLTVADHVVIAAKAEVAGSIKKPGIYSSGTGLFELPLWHRMVVHLRNLDALFKRVKQLEKLS